MLTSWILHNYICNCISIFFEAFSNICWILVIQWHFTYPEAKNSEILRPVFKRIVIQYDEVKNIYIINEVIMSGSIRDEFMLFALRTYRNCILLFGRFYCAVCDKIYYDPYFFHILYRVPDFRCWPPRVIHNIWRGASWVPPYIRRAIHIYIYYGFYHVVLCSYRV